MADERGVASRQVSLKEACRGVQMVMRSLTVMEAAVLMIWTGILMLQRMLEWLIGDEEVEIEDELEDAGSEIVEKGSELSEGDGSWAREEADGLVKSLPDDMVPAEELRVYEFDLNADFAMDNDPNVVQDDMEVQGVNEILEAQREPGLEEVLEVRGNC
ncbi:hypothetical protein R1sor_012074 [Riccia sorocarpa]|uniref:Uncharacterized protein n=1 Tax=Riccia sorocarpa TaxID=122646 RepID=A0ABD3I2S2_9MARC